MANGNEFELELVNDDEVSVSQETDKAKGTSDVIIAFPKYRLNKVRKAPALSENRKTKIWSVPKSGTYISTRKKIKAPLMAEFEGGHMIIQLNIYRPLTFAARKALYEEGKAQGKVFSAADKDLFEGELPTTASSEANTETTTPNGKVRHRLD